VTRGLLPAFVLAGTLAACGGEVEPVRYAEPQVVEIGATTLDGLDGAGFLLGVRRLRIGADGWAVEASVVNRTPVLWQIGRPHVQGTKFGLFAAPTADELTPRRLEDTGRTTPPLLATRFEPPLPGLLEPGAGWSGRFSGPGRIPRGNFVRVAFGRFTTTETPPDGLPQRLMALSGPAVRVR
jgi:hypothetical protein